MELSKNIKARQSIRQYKPDAPVTKQQIELLLTAAMHAPSACNTRPWEFLVITNREVLSKLADAHPYAKMLQTASLAIIVCGLPDAQRSVATGYFPQDCAAATQNLLVQAADIGLGTCWCGVYPKEDRIAEIREVVDIPENVVPFNIIAVGVKDEQPPVRGFYDPEKVKYIE